MFSTEEMQFMVNALDAYVRQTGLQHAAMSLNIVAKLQAAAAAPVPAPKVEQDDEPTTDEVVEEAPAE